MSSCSAQYKSAVKNGGTLLDVVCAKQITFIPQKNKAVAIQATLILFGINCTPAIANRGILSGIAYRAQFISLAAPKLQKSAQSGKPGLHPSANSTFGSLSKIAFGLRTDWSSTAGHTVNVPYLQADI